MVIIVIIINISIALMLICAAVPLWQWKLRLPKITSRLIFIDFQISYLLDKVPEKINFSQKNLSLYKVRKKLLALQIQNLQQIARVIISLRKIYQRCFFIKLNK
ncbi:hypothetical protein [Richelia intracellularis]|uniref:hypothetical protein n=1 Tax=Richelia intracellularis TaxID=1164990 RepID=UPI0005C7E5F8|nr:hypothetical protein [Richelia intracellularis]